MALGPDEAPSCRWPDGGTTAYPCSSSRRRAATPRRSSGTTCSVTWPLVDAGRIKVYSWTASPGRAHGEGRGLGRSTAAGCSTSSKQAIAPRGGARPSMPTPAGPQEVVVAGASIGAFNALAMICRYPAAVPRGGVHERHLRHRAASSAGSPTTSSSPRRPLPARPRGPAARAAAPAVRLPRFRLRCAGRTSASPGGRRRCSGRRGSRTASTTGVPEYDHDWPTWWKMLPTYVEQALSVTRRRRARRRSSGSCRAGPRRPRPARGDPVGRERRRRAGPRSARERPPSGRRLLRDVGVDGVRPSRPPTAASRSSVIPPARTARRRSCSTRTTTSSRRGTSARGILARGSSPSGTAAGTARGAADCKGNLVMLSARCERCRSRGRSGSAWSARGRRRCRPAAWRAWCGAEPELFAADVMLIADSGNIELGTPDGDHQPARDRQRPGDRANAGRTCALGHVRRRRARCPGRADLDAGNAARRRRCDHDRGSGRRRRVDRRRLPGRAVPFGRRRPRRGRRHRRRHRSPMRCGRGRPSTSSPSTAPPVDGCDRAGPAHGPGAGEPSRARRASTRPTRSSCWSSTSTAAAPVGRPDHGRAARPWGSPFAARTDGPGITPRSPPRWSRLSAGRWRRPARVGPSRCATRFQAAHPDAEILLIGVEEPACRIHAPDESVSPDELRRTAVAEALLLRALGAGRRLP